ncbi:MAG: DUF4411 family protein [Actinobacteria bacterium]|nr:DUF4411 family protein [Actinomycetota bacterium]
MDYLVDANVLIEAKNRYYSFSICPGFWDALVWYTGSGSVRSVDVVKRELADGNDDLAEWVKHTAPSSAFCSTNDADAVAWYGRIMNWVLAEQRFTPSAKDEFAQEADPWLVAYAGAHGMTLVTQETPAPLSRNNVKIPDVCRHFGVPWQNSFGMLDDLGVAFGWSAPAG